VGHEHTTRSGSSVSSTIIPLAHRAAQEERALDVDVPELVRATPLVGWPAFSAGRRAGSAESGQQAIDGVVVERIDLTAGELGGQALRVPVGQEADDDDRLLDPPGQACRVWATWSIDKRLETAGVVAAPPAMKALPADPQGEGRCDALLAGDADTSDPETNLGQTTPGGRSGRATAASREKQEARTLLVGVTKETTMRLGAIPDR
jgi:hypothetical protein